LISWGKNHNWAQIRNYDRSEINKNEHTRR
jgi:hypothetical protein